jgi:DNA modification methylase
MPDQIERLEYIEIDRLTPYANNARTHSDEQIKKIQASLREFGFVNPVLVDKDNGIIAGHGRVEAARREGLTEVPCVRIEHLTEAQKKAYILADNRLALDAGWDMGALRFELEGLKEIDFAIDLIGFDSEELADILNDKAEVVEDDYEVAIPEMPKTHLGDIYRLGRHRLMCGDSTDSNDITRLMGGQMARMCVTDPPWNVGIGLDSNPRHRQRSGLVNDSMSSQDFAKFLDMFISAVSPHLEGDMYCCLGASEWPQLDAAMRKNGYHWSATIIWVKDSFVLGRSNYHRRYEPMWYGWLDGKASSYNGKRNLNDVWEFKRPRVSVEHPTMKPIELWSEAIINSSKPNDIIIDPFGGSGTAIIAAEQTNRTAFSMELDPKYCDVIIYRWEQFTGQKAVKL